MISLALCSFQRQNKRAKERGWQGVSPDCFTVGAGEAREKNENLGTRKGSQEPSLGWKEKSGFIVPYNGFQEEIKKSF